MGFPRFDGWDLAIWLVKCEDYFVLYCVLEAMKVVAASMNMEDTAARWLQVHRLKRGIGRLEKCSQSNNGEVWG